MIMRVRITIVAAQFIVAIFGMLKERSWKPLAFLLGSIAFFFTVPRYLVCSRCEKYGKNCHSLYLGKVTSLYLPRVEGKKISPVGAGLEGATLAMLANAPLVGLRGNRKYLALYLLLSNLTLGLHLRHACMHCLEYGDDRTKNCPGAKAAGLLFKGQRVQF
jgi:hypothetical protein